MFLSLWGVLRLSIASFLSGDSCLLPMFIIYPRSLTCCFELCVFFLRYSISVGSKEIKGFMGVLT